MNVVVASSVSHHQKGDLDTPMKANRLSEKAQDR